MLSLATLLSKTGANGINMTFSDIVAVLPLTVAVSIVAKLI